MKKNFNQRSDSAKSEDVKVMKSTDTFIEYIDKTK